MIHLNKYIEFITEISRKDIHLIKSLQDTDLFTIAYEFELITEDDKNYLVDLDKLSMLSMDIISDIKEQFDLKNINKYKSLINKLKEKLSSQEQISITDFKTILEQIIYGDKVCDYIKNLILIELVGGKESPKILVEDIEYLKSEVSKNLPNFIEKWGSELTYELDETLIGKNEDGTYSRGIEFKPTTYIISISKTIEILDDFYSDYEKQSYWKMTSKTGLHINIGINQKVHWNPLKGLVMLSELPTDKSDIPYVFKGMTWRMNTDFTNSLKKKVIETIKRSKKLKSQIDALDIHEIKTLENTLNPILVNVIDKVGVKYFGFNLIHLAQKKYVEFRHVGGDVSKCIVIEKLIYFCYIVYLMTTDYKDNDYHKKLYKFMENLNHT